MSNHVSQLTPAALAALQTQLLPYAQASKNPYALLVAKFQTSQVTLYKSGKVLIQGGNPLATAQALGLESAQQESDSRQAIHQDCALIGSDEVGNGSYFGGLSVVASLVRPEDHAWLRSLGVGDSKTLTDQKIRTLAPLLEARIPHKALLLSPKKYNQVVGEGLMHNAVSVKVALHNQAIYLLLQEVSRPDAIIIDAFTSPGNYQKYLKREANQFQNPISLVEKAESQYLAVAVSSILARCLFLDNLDQLGQDLGLKLPSGAGTASDQVASTILSQQGMEALAGVAKLHFKNTQKAQQLIKKGK